MLLWHSKLPSLCLSAISYSYHRSHILRSYEDNCSSFQDLNSCHSIEHNAGGSLVLFGSQFLVLAIALKTSGVYHTQLQTTACVFSVLRKESLTSVR